MTEDGNIFAVNNYNKLQYLDTKTSELRTFPGPVIEENEECRRMFMMKDGRLCIMTSNSTYLISFDNALSPAIRKVESLAIPCLYVAPRYDDSNYLLITADRRLCSFNIEDGTLETKAEIDSPFPGNDDVTGIIPTDSTYLIGFRESGVKILEKGQKQLLDTDIDCRVLSLIPDKTLHQIIKEARIELAAKLLTSSKLTIDEIMFKVGYENRSTFHRNFKEAKGMTPKEYRQRAQDKAFQTLSDAD